MAQVWAPCFLFHLWSILVVRADHKRPNCGAGETLHGHVVFRPTFSVHEPCCMHIVPVHHPVRHSNRVTQICIGFVATGDGATRRSIITPSHFTDSGRIFTPQRQMPSGTCTSLHTLLPCEHPHRFPIVYPPRCICGRERFEITHRLAHPLGNVRRKSRRSSNFKVDRCLQRTRLETYR